MSLPNPMDGINRFNVETMIAEVLSDFATHDWLKESLAAAITRDPVDAIKDAEILVMLLQARLDRVALTATRELAN